jgi:hypothetical protein
MGHEKSKGLVPVSWGEALFASTERLVPVAGRGVKSVLHRFQTSSLPHVKEPHRNKQKGQNKNEDELAADHVLIDDFARM